MDCSKYNCESFQMTGYERRIIKGAGHNLPQEAPEEFAEAVLKLMRG
jgi:pimeloyl-ACP methyl ester carboxylesterase